MGDRPHTFVQLRADFSSSEAKAGARLDFLQFAVSTPPAASQVLAEIEPQQVPLAELTRFTYKLRPVIGELDLGFDTIEIETPVAPASVDEVRIGLDTLRTGQFGVDPHDGERFAVQIPRIGPDQSDDLIEVVFHSEVFKVGTVFSARVFASARPHEVHQRVTAGDADPFADSNSLTVYPAQIGEAVIRAFRVSPFTPNGDGINDVLQVEYDLVNVAGEVPATLVVYDLSGSRVVSLPVPAVGSGRFPAAWDGTDGGRRWCRPVCICSASRWKRIAVRTRPSPRCRWSTSSPWQKSVARGGSPRRGWACTSRSGPSRPRLPRCRRNRSRRRRTTSPRPGQTARHPG